MIKTEQIEIDGVTSIHSWSDAGRQIVRDGVAYDDAYDPPWLGRTYTEGDPIEGDTAEEIVSILTGEAE